MVTAVRRTAGVPFGLVAGTVNRAGSLLKRGASDADVVKDQAEAAVDEAEAAAGKTGEAVEQVLDLTDLDETHEPFPAYSRLSGDSVMRHVADSDDVEHLREILAFEQAHKARKGVLQALEGRLQELTVSA